MRVGQTVHRSAKRGSNRSDWASHKFGQEAREWKLRKKPHTMASIDWRASPKNRICAVNHVGTRGQDLRTDTQRANRRTLPIKISKAPMRGRWLAACAESRLRTVTSRHPTQRCALCVSRMCKKQTPCPFPVLPVQQRMHSSFTIHNPSAFPPPFFMP